MADNTTATAPEPETEDDIPEQEFATFSKGGGMQANVDVLIEKYRAKIDKLREKVRDFVPQDDPQYDDVFYLRYVLSYKAKTTKCVEPIRYAVNYRQQYAEVRQRIHTEGVTAVPHHSVAMRFQCTGMCGSLPTGEPIWVVRTAHSMQSELLNSLSREDVAEWMLLSKEVQYHICDTQTRATRKLCKMITVIDLQGFSLGKSDRRFFKVGRVSTLHFGDVSLTVLLSQVLGDSAKQSAKCFPQLLGKTVIVNAPSFFR